MTHEAIFQALCVPSELTHEGEMERPDLFISNLSTDQCLPLSVRNLEAEPTRLTTIRCDDPDIIGDLATTEVENAEWFFYDDEGNFMTFNDRMREVADGSDYVIAGVEFQYDTYRTVFPHVIILKNDPNIFDSKNDDIWLKEYCRLLLIVSREFTLLYEVGDNLAYVIEFISDKHEEVAFAQITRIEQDGDQVYKRLCLKKWWAEGRFRPWQVSYYAEPAI